ncbi:MAG: cytochrome P460 family protein [Pseudomonadota bacterium]
MSPSPSAPSFRAICACLLLATLIASPADLPAEETALPEQHFSVEDPADLTPDEAEAIYARLRADMAAAYALSRNPDAANYQRWQRFNKAPYSAATHGGRYVSNYGNALAGSYAEGEAGTPMPEGAVLAKDAFAVTTEGDVFLGPLFLMEKMPPGFDPKARDWRYSMIMPDGSYFGMSGGDNAERVQFCITCHAEAGDRHDHLFFVPEAFRTGD